MKNDKQAHSITNTQYDIEAIERNILSILDEMDDIEPNAQTLDSSDNVVEIVRILAKDRDTLSLNRKHAHANLIKIARDCAYMEKKLKVFGLVAVRTPKRFMREMLEGKHLGLSFEDILEKKQEADQALLDFAEESKTQVKIKDLDDEKLSSFKAELEALSENVENYAFVEDTSGFFCYEVLAAYKKHLFDTYDNCFFETNPEVFTIERVQ